MQAEASDRQVPDLFLHDLIVHKVDHKNYDQPVLADLKSTISDEVASFIRQHISRNRRHKNASTARYRHDTLEIVDTVHELTDAILCDNSLFVEKTRRIAELLFNAQKTRSTSPGELVVCLFSEAAQRGDLWVAIMKMDPEDGFVGREERVGDKVRIVLERVKDVLPTGELQKCAFVLPLRRREKTQCDLIVLDQQLQNYGGNRQVASYFLDEFLMAERDLNNGDLTRGFLRQVNKWTEGKLHSRAWTFERYESLREAAVTAVQQPMVDIPAFVHQHLNDEVEENQFIEELTSSLADIGKVSGLVFSPDPYIRQQTEKYRSYKGDFGLRLRVQVGPDVPPDLFKHDFDASTNTHTITIKTTMWNEG